MNIILIESPYAARWHKGVHYAVEDCEAYLNEALRLAIHEGFAPFASHRMYTSCLDDKITVERALGMSLALPFLEAASEVWVFGDLGISEGMEQGIADAKRLRKVIRKRSLKGWA